jgi:hypothetical protein
MTESKSVDSGTRKGCAVAADAVTVVVPSVPLPVEVLGVAVLGEFSARTCRNQRTGETVKIAAATRTVRSASSTLNAA